MIICKLWLDVFFSLLVFSICQAEIAFLGMVEALNAHFDRQRKNEILALRNSGELDEERLTGILRRKVRIEKVAIKDIKLRTFIAEGSSRNDLAAHVYDVTYGSIVPDRDTLVIIDDSIVRGTTLKQSILRILDRLRPVRIIIVSSSPQVRYPDYYGIDMPHLDELAAFRAAVRLLRKTGREHILDEVYERCLRCDEHSDNAVNAVYEPFTEEEIAAEMALMLTPPEIRAKVELVFQTLDGLHDAIPSCPGDWYFSGDYPTEGGLRMVNRAFADYYENRR